MAQEKAGALRCLLIFVFVGMITIGPTVGGLVIVGVTGHQAHEIYQEYTN